MTPLIPLAFRHMPFPLAVLDTHGHVVAASEQLERLLGHPAGGLDGLAWNRLFEPEVAVDEGDRAWDGVPTSGQARLLRRDGDSSVCRYRLVPVPEGDAVQGWTLALDPVAALTGPMAPMHQMADNHKEAYSAFFEQLFSMLEEPQPELDAQIAVAFLDRDLVYRWNNPLHAEMLAMPTDRIIGRHVFEVRPELRAAMEPVYRRVLETGEVHQITAMPIVLSRGGQTRTIHVDLRYIPVTGEGGAIIGLLMALVDASDRIEKERLQRSQLQTLRAAEAIKDKFLGMVSHELRTPLAVILQNTEMLDEQLGAETRPRTLVARIERSALQLKRLVNDLLDASQLQAGRFAIRREPTALAGLLEAALDAVRARAEARSVSLALAAPAALPVVDADAQRLEQALVNLLTNALTHAPAGSRVTLETRRQGEYWLIAVEDEGPGVPPAIAPRLFQPFVSQRRGPEHVGLGLYIARAIAEAHGGAMGFEAAKAGGARFWLSLPAEG